MSKKLEVCSLSKKYKNTSLFANDHFNVSFYEGEITAILGHNGAGKTTLLNQIIGLIKPTYGCVNYDGYCFTKNPTKARSNVSMMPQLHAPLKGVTMRQSIETIVKIRGLEKRAAIQATNDILEELKIKEWANQPGEKLSGGLQRLASFAMAVSCAPAIILLDEPTNDVDPIRRQLVWKYLNKLAKKNHIILVITHNLLEVEKYADRFLLLHKGKIVKDYYIKESQKINGVAHRLTIVTKRLMHKEDLPQKSYQVFESELRYEFEISSEQLLGVMSWLQQKITQKEVRYYRLSSKTLEETYKEWMDESQSKNFC